MSSVRSLAIFTKRSSGRTSPSNLGPGQARMNKGNRPNNRGSEKNAPQRRSVQGPSDELSCFAAAAVAAEPVAAAALASGQRKAR